MKVLGKSDFEKLKLGLEDLKVKFTVTHDRKSLSQHLTIHATGYIPYTFTFTFDLEGKLLRYGSFGTEVP